MTVDFPYARTLLAVQATRTFPRTGQSSVQTRYFLSSLEPPERTPAQWIALVRGHWGGVENRNHWRRDALQGEEPHPHPRLRHPDQSRAAPQCLRTPAQPPRSQRLSPAL
jgi:hypothetical protein